MHSDSVTVRADIDAPVEVAWRVLTVERDSWWPEMRFTAAVGASLSETWTEDGHRMSATGTVTRCLPPHGLAFRWIEPRWSLPLDVDIRLARRSGATSVTLVESGFVRATSSPTLPAEHEDGWMYHLERWKRASERAVNDDRVR